LTINDANNFSSLWERITGVVLPIASVVVEMARPAGAWEVLAVSKQTTVMPCEVGVFALLAACHSVRTQARVRVRLDVAGYEDDPRMVLVDVDPVISAAVLRAEEREQSNERLRNLWRAVVSTPVTGRGGEG
jgi:hypothetical protein